MITLRKSDERGQTRLGWLDSRHSFSFGRYRDPRHTGFHSLLVINEDRVAAGGGFGRHPHEDMEILSYVLEGEMVHRDSMGNGSIIRPGELQRMTAGTGITHSEFNASSSNPLHFYQIWLEPERRGLDPGYEQVAPTALVPGNGFQYVAGPEPAPGAVTIHQDARLYLARLDAGETVRRALDPARHAWVQLIQGSIELNGLPLAEGDGAALEDESFVGITARVPSAVLLFDLA